jgi:menaquinone-9 beta-reductase
VLATGKHEMRGLPRTTTGEGALGLKLHLRLRADPPEGVALLACRGGYAGLQPTAGGLANLCAALRVREADTAAVARDPAALLAHVAAGSDLAATLLAGAEPAQPRPLAVARIPYGFLHRDQPGGAPEGLWRIGDQFAVIPSFSGDGVAMALAGGLGAARAIASGDGASAAAFHAALRHRLAGPMRVAGLVALLLGHAPGALVAATARLPGAARQVARRTRLPGDLMA